jgi:von Willebrand factor type A domain
VVVLAVAGWVALGGVAAADVGVVATLVSADGGQARSLVDVEPAPARPLPGGAITVSAGGAQLPVTATPLLADSLALGLVLDASAAGAPALAQGLSGAANLVLQLPAAAAVGVVTDTSRPALLAPPSPGPTATLKALDRVRPGGTRQTGAALSMAARLLPDTPGPRVLVLYTGAADAGAVSAANLTATLVEQNVVLAVVSTSTDPAYWSKVATATGGAVVPTNPTNAIGAFSTVAELLRTRYQLTFTLPQPAPKSVTISVDNGTGPRTAQAAIVTATPTRPAAPRTDSNSGTLRWAILIAVAVLVAANVVWLLVRARRRRPPAAPAAGAPDAKPAPAPAAAPVPVAGPVAGPAEDPAKRPAEEPANDAANDAVNDAVNDPADGSGEKSGQQSWGDRMAAAIAANPLPVYDGPPADTRPDEPNPPAAPAGGVVGADVDQAAGAAAAGGPDPAGGHGMGAAGTAGVNGAGGTGPADDKAYMLLDATVAEAAAAVEAGRVDAAHAVARIALAAAGRVDLIDRRVTSEARLARASQAIWPPPARVLALLREARLVSAGEADLTGPDGVQVRQDGATLRLSRQGEWVCDCGSAAELADHVDVDDLAVSQRAD